MNLETITRDDSLALLQREVEARDYWERRARRAEDELAACRRRACRAVAIAAAAVPMLALACWWCWPWWQPVITRFVPVGVPG